LCKAIITTTQPHTHSHKVKYYNHTTESFRITANTIHIKKRMFGPIGLAVRYRERQFLSFPPPSIHPPKWWWWGNVHITLCNWFRHHPFSELSASAGELLHDSLADSNLHGHRPAISSRQHPLMGSNMSQHSDPISALSDHPASPVLLTSEWPTWSQIHRYNAVVTFFHHSVKHIVLSFVVPCMNPASPRAPSIKRRPGPTRRTGSHTRDGYWFHFGFPVHATSQFEDRSRRRVRYPQTCSQAPFAADAPFGTPVSVT
jgi:hypothetical protein